MGERLVVEIKRNQTPVAAVYYHWSAYTMPALNVLSDMYERVLAFADRTTNEELQLALIKFSEKYCGYGYFETKEDLMVMKEQLISELSQSIPKDDESGMKMATELIIKLLTGHGGVHPDDFEVAKKQHPKEDFSMDVDRNNGLVAIQFDTMKHLLDWADGIMIVDLDEKSVINNNVYAYDVSEYLEETEDYDDDVFIPPECVEKIPVDIGTFSLEEIPVVLEILTPLANERWFRYQDTIFELKM